MTLAPFREVVVHSLQVREHRSLLTRNHLPKQARFQASWSRANQLAPKPLTSSNRGTISLPMSTSVRKVAAVFSPAAPHAVNEVERVAGRFTSRAHEPRPNSTLAKPNDRHRPLAQNNLNLDAVRRDHDGARGNPCERGVGMVLRPRQRDGPADLRDGFRGQSQAIADGVSIWARMSACSEASHLK